MGCDVDIAHVKRMPEERIPKLIMDWILRVRRKRVRQRKTWMEVVKAAAQTRNLEPDQWRNREEWRLVSGRGDSCLKKRTDSHIIHFKPSFNIYT